MTKEIKSYYIAFPLFVIAYYLWALMLQEAIHDNLDIAYIVTGFTFVIITLVLIIYVNDKWKVFRLI